MNKKKTAILRFGKLIGNLEVEHFTPYITISYSDFLDDMRITTDEFSYPPKPNHKYLIIRFALISMNQNLGVYEYNGFETFER